MNKKYILFFLLFFLKTLAFSQLPIGYRLIKDGSSVGRDNYYTNGRINILHDVIQEFGDGGASNWIKDSYKGFTTIETKDGLIVGIGNQNGTYMYMVFKGNHYYIVTSKLNSKEFSDMSKYVLKKVRELGTLFLEH